MAYLVLLASACHGEVALGGTSPADSGPPYTGYDGSAGFQVPGDAEGSHYRPVTGGMDAGNFEQFLPIIDSSTSSPPDARVDQQLLAYDGGHMAAPVSFWNSDAGACTAANLCAESETLLPKPPSVLAAEEMLLGDLAACATVPYFLPGSVGLRIDADGTFQELALSGGSLVESGQGFAGHGTWTVIDNGPDYQLNLLYTQSGVPLNVAFATNPRKISVTTGDPPVVFAAAECP